MRPIRFFLRDQEEKADGLCGPETIPIRPSFAPYRALRASLAAMRWRPCLRPPRLTSIMLLFKKSRQAKIVPGIHFNLDTYCTALQSLESIDDPEEGQTNIKNKVSINYSLKIYILLTIHTLDGCMATTAKHHRAKAESSAGRTWRKKALVGNSGEAASQLATLCPLLSFYHSCSGDVQSPDPFPQSTYTDGYFCCPFAPEIRPDSCGKGMSRRC
jgi:hypothetical protein